MAKKDTVSSLFWIAVGLVVCTQGHGLGLGSFGDPGSGFMVFWVGVIMMLLSAIIFVKSLRNSGEAGELALMWAGTRWKKVILLLLLLFFYCLVFTAVGFLISTALLMVGLFKLVEPQRWLWAVAGAAVSTAAAYGLFRLWLGVQLPEGVFGV